MRSELIRRLHSLTLHDGDGDERFADALRGAAAARAAAARTAAARRRGLLYERGGPWASCEVSEWRRLISSLLIAHPLTHSTHSLHSLTHPPTHSLTHSLTHSFTHSLTHSLTH